MMEQLSLRTQMAEMTELNDGIIWAGQKKRGRDKKIK